MSFKSAEYIFGDRERNIFLEKHHHTWTLVSFKSSPPSLFLEDDWKIKAWPSPRSGAFWNLCRHIPRMKERGQRITELLASYPRESGPTRRRLVGVCGLFDFGSETISHFSIDILWLGCHSWKAWKFRERNGKIRKGVWCIASSQEKPFLTFESVSSSLVFLGSSYLKRTLLCSSTLKTLIPYRNVKKNW